MAQERKIIPNLFTSGGEFRLRTDGQGGPGEEYQGSFHYDIDEDKYYTYATPEMGLEVSREIVPLDTEARDENGYLIAPYNAKKNYNIKLSRKKFEDVKEVIDTTISELLPPDELIPELTIEERIEILKAEFGDLKNHITDPDLDYLIRESLLESSGILTRGNTDEIVLTYFDIAHFGIEMKADLADEDDGEGPVGPKVLIEVNGTDVFDGEVNHTDYRWYNFMIPMQSEGELQEIKITFDNDYFEASLGEDRNLYVSKIKNKPFAYHAYAENPDIVEEDTINVPEITSSIQTSPGVFSMIPATPYDREAPYAGFEENVFEFRNEDSVATTVKDYFNNPLESSQVILYDVDGDVPLSRPWNGNNTDINHFPGQFKQKMWGNCQLQVDLPTDWFLSEYPPQPVEFTTDDFQIGTIKSTKIDLVECQLRSELQQDSINAITNRLEEENEEFKRRAEEAEAVSGSQAAEIQSMKLSIEQMQEQWIQLWDGDSSGHNMVYNARLESGKNTGAGGNGHFWRTSNRPKYWSSPNGYEDAGNNGSPRMLGYYYQSGAPDSSVHGYPGDGTAKGKIQLCYFNSDGELSPEGWPNERQVIGFRMKANNYRGWPRVRLTAKGATDGGQTKSVTSRNWKIYWYEISLGDVGIENKDIELFIAFINNRAKKNNRKGKDRDVWISHIVREDGQMIPLDKTNSPAMDSPELRWGNEPPTGKSFDDKVLVEENTPDYQPMTAEYTDVSNRRTLRYPYYYSYYYRRSYSNYYNSGWEGKLPPNGKLEGNSGIRITLPANSPHVFVKGEAGSAPKNKWAAIYCGGTDDMDETHGIFVLPYYKYKFEFCCRIRTDVSKTHNDHTSGLTSNTNTRIRAGVADIRNGWRGANNPFPGTQGYAWQEWEDFDLAIDDSDPDNIVTYDPTKWRKFTIEFIPKPGPQGGTKIYFAFCGHRGRDGEPQLTEWAEPRIIGPIDETYTI
tara:strand:- start:104 stop:2989 length:2886 start_codon:yes stop_codon:yes gene_type:complete